MLTLSIGVERLPRPQNDHLNEGSYTMIMKLFAKWGLRASEKEITSFLSVFSQGDVEKNGIVLGMAALLHHRLTEKDPEFEALLNSNKGENQGPLSVYIIHLNRLFNEFRKLGRSDEAAATKLWNITVRCMTDESLHHHGVSLWKIASSSFLGARKWMETRLEYAEKAGHHRDAADLKSALKLYNFVPPQFFGN
jgi:hypothetical protein